MIKEKIYVKNDEGSIYLVSLSKNCSYLNESNLENSYLEYNLEMISCRDYFSEDIDIVGNCSKYHVTRGYRDDTILVYPFSESLKDRIEEEGYKIVDSKLIEKMSIDFNEFSKWGIINEVVESVGVSAEEKENIEEKLEELCKDLFTEENINLYKEDSDYFFKYLREKIR
ncbi:MAG: hypothetical protein ACLTDM_15310 [Clostridium butyricum]